MQSIADGENVIHDGKIFSPTPEVKKYKYNNNHSYDEGYVDCGVNRQVGLSLSIISPLQVNTSITS